MRLVPTLLVLLAATVGGAAMWLLAGLDYGYAATTIERTCGLDNGCAELAASPWAVLPPRVPPFGEGGRRLPLSVLGLLQFLLVGAHVLVARRVPRPLAWIGLLGSLFYLGVSLFELPAWCRFCLVGHAANIAVFLIAHRADRRPSSPSGARAPLLATLLATALWTAFLVQSQPPLQKQLARYRGAQHAFAEPERAAEFDRWLEAPGAGAAEEDSALHRLLVFGHPDCLACRAFLRFLELRVRPLAGERLHVELRVHGPGAHAEALSRSLEAARLAGCFAPAYEQVLALEPGAPHDPRALARALGLEPAEFERLRASREVAARLARDRAAVEALGVREIPAVFLDRVRLDTRLLGYEPFWRAVLEPR